MAVQESPISDEKVTWSLPPIRRDRTKIISRYQQRTPISKANHTFAANDFQLMKTTGTSTDDSIDEYTCDQVIIS